MWLCADPGAPLHFLHTFRQWYVATYRDPLIEWTPASGAALGAGGSWTALFLWMELLFSLPVVVYAARRLTAARAPTMTTTTTGPLELLLLVYALETALTTAVCIHDVGYWSPSAYSAADKNVFRFQLYGPWLVMRESPLASRMLSCCQSSLTRQPPCCLPTCTHGFWPGSRQTAPRKHSEEGEQTRQGNEHRLRLGHRHREIEATWT